MERGMGDIFLLTFHQIERGPFTNVRQIILSERAAFYPLVATKSVFNHKVLKLSGWVYSDSINML